MAKKPKNKDKKTKGKLFILGGLGGPGRGYKKISPKTEEFRQFLAETYNIEPDNFLLDVIIEIFQSSDPKLKARLAEVISKKIPKPDPKPGPILAPHVVEIVRDWSTRCFDLDDEITEEREG